MALSADQIWQRLVDKDTRLKDDDATIEFTAANLRRLLRQVHGQGEAIGREEERVNSTAKKFASNPINDLFGGL